MYNQPNRNPGGRGFGRGSGGRGGRGGRGTFQSTVSEEAPLYSFCRYNLMGQCRNPTSCRFPHDLINHAFSAPICQSSINSLAVLPVSPPKILIGSTDNKVRVFDLSTTNVEMPIDTQGKVTHIEVDPATSLVMWACDEPLSQTPNDIPVGVVRVFNTNDFSTLPMYINEQQPYTHPFADIRSFKITNVNNNIFIITGGGEGVIKIWRFDQLNSKFECISNLVGHVRAINCLLLVNDYLWSGSMDNSIRVWEIQSGQSIGELSNRNGGFGHSGAVSCLCLLPGQEQYIASGGFDNALKIWNTNGEALHSLTHAHPLTALSTFQDDYGGIPLLLIGLKDGSICIRSCLTMNLLFSLDSGIFKTQVIWSIIPLGKSCFAAGGADGQIIGLKIDKAIQDKQ